jgi:hypothetical protein
VEVQLALPVHREAAIWPRSVLLGNPQTPSTPPFTQPTAASAEQPQAGRRATPVDGQEIAAADGAAPGRVAGTSLRVGDALFPQVLQTEVHGLLRAR